MILNPELEGLLSAVQAPARTYISRTVLRRTRFLMTLLPVPVYCAVLALFGIEDLPAVGVLVLTPVAMLWYAVDYFLHSSTLRYVLKEAAHYGLFLTPSITLVLAGYQPISEAWAFAKGILFWGELVCCSVLALVLWRDWHMPQK